MPAMPAATVVALLDDFDRAGIDIWVDGGWGIDALLGAQHRPHGDLDIVIQSKHLDALVACLRSQGYDDVPRPDTRPWNFVLGDGHGHQVDIHVVTFANTGDGIYGPPENDEAYPAGSLTGHGTIAGRPVRCTSAEFQVQSHSGYDLTDKDFGDVSRLCDRFGLDLPPEYARFLT